MRLLFPLDKYTPSGYIDNPYHSWALNRSGVIYSRPALGFGWQVPGSDYVADWVYSSFLQLSLVEEGKRFHTFKDFKNAAVDLHSRYHSKNIVSYDWVFDSLHHSFSFLLALENTLSCLAYIRNSSKRSRKVVLHAACIYSLGEDRWWGGDGVAGHYDREKDMMIVRSFAAGTVCALKSELRSVSHRILGSPRRYEEALAENVSGNTETGYVVGKGKPLFGLMTFVIDLPALAEKNVLFTLNRWVNEVEIWEHAQMGLKNSRGAHRERIREDNAFWGRAPRLTGDWPEIWRRGWVYDWETQRMNTRLPVGRYRHRWDGMQIHAPRSVLGETSIDMMMMSYADHDLAKEVFLGIFTDSPGPYPSCMREDGSMNMVAADGNECPTAVNWCFPFYSLESIFLRNVDRKWLNSIYPHLRRFLEWTLKERTDDEGWIVFKCSWESGQDASKRFRIDQKTGGEVTSFVRTVDGQASFAHAARTMQFFAHEMGDKEEEDRWGRIAEDFTEKTLRMWTDGWFYDFDTRTMRPIRIRDYFDVMMLSPVMCRVATKDQIRELIPMFRYFSKNPRYWLEWPSFMYQYCESAWNAGLKELVSRVVENTADRTYKSIDRRGSRLGRRPGQRLPGVSCEFWGVGGAGGAEGYGWGATLPFFILRNIIGFRETSLTSKRILELSPNLSSGMLKRGKTYGVDSLHYRGVDLDVSYEVMQGNSLKARLRHRSKIPVTIKIESVKDNEILVEKKRKQRERVVVFEGLNRRCYHIDLAE